MTKKSNLTQTIIRLYRIALNVCPGRIMAYIFSVFACGLRNVALTFGIQNFYDAVRQSTIEGVMRSDVSLFLMILLAIVILSKVMNGFDNYYGESLHVVLSGEYVNRINKKIAKIDPINFENQDFLNLLNERWKARGILARHMYLLL
jgi:hypothetical protein